MRRIGPSGTLLTCLAILLATNAGLLGLAAWNRGGQAPARLELTERELALPRVRDREQSGLWLDLTLGTTPPRSVAEVGWRRGIRFPRMENAWLTIEKARALGFRAEVDPAAPDAPEAYTAEVPRLAFVVLEYDGPAWQAYLAGQEARVERLRAQAASGDGGPEDLKQAETLLALDRAMRSRLLPVDAGTDEARLRGQYPDAGRHLIVRARLVLSTFTDEAGVTRLDVVVEPLPAQVHVPAAFRNEGSELDKWGSERVREGSERVSGAIEWPEPVEPRYRAVVLFGRRLEPWLQTLTAAP